MAFVERRSLIFGLSCLLVFLLLSYAIQAHFARGCWKGPAGVTQTAQLTLEQLKIPEAADQRTLGNLQKPDTIRTLSAACQAWKDNWEARGYVDSGSWNSEAIVRNFREQPLELFGTKHHWLFGLYNEADECDVGCRTFGPPMQQSHFDATVHFDSRPQEIDRHNATFFVMRNTESPSNFGHQLAAARALSDGYDSALTFELSANVSILYSTYYTAAQFFAPPFQTDKKIKGAAAFISNCDMVTSFRMEAIEKMQELGIIVNSFGKCGHNKNISEEDSKIGSRSANHFAQKHEEKVHIARQYMFLCVFENSVWDDYVTEKFFHSLEAGAVPIVVGASNVGDFAPSPGSFLRIDSPEDIPRVVAAMKEAMENVTFYESMLEWKYREPTPAFRALIDLSAVHSTCRLCINLADRIRRLESVAGDSAQPASECSCRSETEGSDALISYMLLVRERGTFRFLPVFLSSDTLSLEGLHDAVMSSFRKANRPVTWQDHRLQVTGLHDAVSIWTGVSVYRVYPIGRTQREVLFGNASFAGDDEVKRMVASQHCPLLEVIFV